MLMNNPLVQSPGWWSLPKKKRFEMASAQSMLSPLAQVQTPQYDHTMGTGAGTAPTPFTSRKGGFKRVLKHLAAMESPGPDWSLEAKNVGVQSPWGISNAPWEALSPGRAWLERKKKEELA